ncbi:MAG: pilus assembly protein PilM [Epulopiscium sp.]|nr:pilus assembly protein PilM [Candidatus Epulonipiscium sp.]
MFKQRILGLEIGNSNIKLLECRKKGENLIVEKSKILKTPSQAISDGIIIDTFKVCDLIENELRKNNYRARDLAIVIKSSEIITRDIRMDKMPAKDLNDIMKLQYHEYLLVDTSEYQITHKVVGEVESGDTEEQEVLIVAAPNRLLNPLIEIADRLKLKIKLINISSDAVSNLFDADNFLMDMKEEEALVIDIGGKSTSVTIISGGVGVLSKDINFGLEELDNMITGHFGSKQIGDLERFKSKYGAIYEDDEDDNNDDIYGKFISKSLKPMIDHKLAPEIRRLLQFHFSRGRKGAIERAYIIGGGAGIKNIDKYMSDLLEIPCTAGINLDMTKVISDEEIQSKSEYFANILGLMSEF